MIALLIGQFYLTLQLGGSITGGSGTHTHEDYNPTSLAVSTVDSAATARVAAGYTWSRFGLEAGYGRLGRYSRSLEFNDPVDDTAGEQVSVNMLDVRPSIYFGEQKRLYAFAIIGAVFYDSEAWDVPNLRWQTHSGTTLGLGGGIGTRLPLSKRFDLTGEISYTGGDFQVGTAQAGIRFKW